MSNPAERNQADVALKVIEDVCRDFDGHGISSVGACACLKAMAQHWKDHLHQGSKPRIISDDIDEVKNLLEIMRAEILRRVVEQTAPNTRDPRKIYETGDVDTGWCAKVLTSGEAFEVQVFDADGERRQEREKPFTDHALAIEYADMVVRRKPALSS